MVRCAYIRMAQHRSMSQRRNGHEAVVSALLAAGADKNLQTRRCPSLLLLLLIMTML